MTTECTLDNDVLWRHACVLFPILKDYSDRKSVYVSVFEYEHVIKKLEEECLYPFVEDLVISEIEEHMRKIVAPAFWSQFYKLSNEIEKNFHLFKNAVIELNNDYLSFLPTMQRLKEVRNILGRQEPIYGETDPHIALKQIISSVLHSERPVPSYQYMIAGFYKYSFKVFHNLDGSKKEAPFLDLNESGEDYRCGGCSGIDTCQCDSIIEDFHTTNRTLIQLGLLEKLAGDVLTELIQRQIEIHVVDTCKGSFNQSFIDPLEKWLESVVLKWLNNLYDIDPDNPSNSNQEKLFVFKQKLQFLLYETYTKLRIDQLFTIIIDYPESEAAVEDLRLCLDKTGLRSHLIEMLQAALQQRLLHPGVNTPDIITAYVHSIRALRGLDPSGLLLDTVTLPVRQYLRCREDTMRCVVMSLTDEGPDGDLADELARGEEVKEDTSENWELWEPPHIDAAIKCSKEKQSWDIISMLVTVYGSKEMFVHEYRNLLADRLLTNIIHSYNTEKEIRYLELLKLRFGDSQLHYCEVMLKDIHDSKRINTHLHSEPNFGLSKQEFRCNCMILSAQFWPPFKEETLQLPQKIKEHLDVYTKAFETLKGNRTLNWKPHLGSVSLEIELKHRTLSLTVSPTQAAIIWHFQEKTEWTIDELSGVLLIPPILLRRRIAFWQSQGLLKETVTDTYCLIEETGSSRVVKGVPDVCEDEETESITASAQDQREEELQVFWSYIVGMLTNLDSLPPERIHQMLKMFAAQGPGGVDCSLQQLKHFLDRKVREHKLLFSGGYYRLPK